MRYTSLVRYRRLCALLGVLASVSCENALEVQRPTLITEENVKGDTAMVSAMVSGVEGEFRRTFVWMANTVAAATDEALFSHVWTPWNTFDNRDVTADGPAYDGITYPFLQRARASGDKFVETLRESLGERAKNHAGFARALAYAGFSTEMIAAHLCAIPINGSAPKTPDEVFQIAIKYLEEAVTVGAAANASDVVHLANVGLARIHLQMGNKSKASEHARKVPAVFIAWSRYDNHPDFGQWTYYNLFYRTSGFRSQAEFNLGLDPAQFANVRDLRVPYESDSTRRLMEPRAPRFAYVPFQPRTFSGWTPGGKNWITGDADIQFASGLEAQYIVAEAGGLAPGELRAFINARRSVGGHAAFAGTDAQLADELLEQRKWDFFFAGYRMKDLLRYKKQYNKDLWPKGRMGGFTGAFTLNYGTVECWPIGVTEKNGNPNIP
ncbi:MAG: hypothetical protein ACT4R6_01490 [Gemmatimonadaceae bacterium]